MRSPRETAWPKPMPSSKLCSLTSRVPLKRPSSYSAISIFGSSVLPAFRPGCPLAICTMSLRISTLQARAIPS
eukprot:11432463-Alexandrium_andersonii.AAC.1